MSGSRRSARRNLFGSVLVVALLAVAGCSGDSSTSSADQTDATTDAATPGDGGEGRSQAGAGTDIDKDSPTDDPTDDSSARRDTDDYLRAAAQALSRRGDTESMAETATGTALDAALAQAAEFEDNGWHQIGVPRIVDVTMVEDDRDDDPARMTVSACVDSSNVDVVDRSGESVRSEDRADRSRMLYTLVRKSGGWLVERESFPDDPDC